MFCKVPASVYTTARCSIVHAMALNPTPLAKKILQAPMVNGLTNAGEWLVVGGPLVAVQLQETAT